MNHFLEDMGKLSGLIGGIVATLTSTGRLAGAIKVCRPCWGDAKCRRAAAAITADGLRLPREFSSVDAWIEHLNTLLDAYVRKAGTDVDSRAADSADEARWQKRWERYRQAKFEELRARSKQRVA